MHPTSITDLVHELQLLIVVFIALVFGLLILGAYLSARKRRARFANAVPAQARVIKVGKSYDSGTYGGYDVDLVLEIIPPAGAPYQLSTTWSVEPLAMPKLKEGQTLSIKIDVGDPKKIYSAEEWAWALDQAPMRYGNQAVIFYKQR